MSDLTNHQMKILVDVTVIATAFSIAGELMMAYYFFKDEKNRKYPMILIFTIVFFDFFYSISNLMILDQNTKFLCGLQGYIREICLNSMVFMSTLILKFAYMHIDPLQSKSLQRLYPKYIKYTLIFASIPANLTAISELLGGPFYFNHPLGFCDLDPPTYSVVMIWIPITLNISFSTYYAFKIRTYIKQKTDDGSYGRKILIYPAVIILTTLPATIDRIVYAILSRPYFPTILVHILLLRLSGFFNALAYRLTVKARPLGSLTNISVTSLTETQIPSMSARPSTVIQIEDNSKSRASSTVERPTYSLEDSLIENFKQII